MMWSYSIWYIQFYAFQEESIQDEKHKLILSTGQVRDARIWIFRIFGLYDRFCKDSVIQTEFIRFWYSFCSIWISESHRICHIIREFQIIRISIKYALKIPWQKELNSFKWRRYFLLPHFSRYTPLQESSNVYGTMNFSEVDTISIFCSGKYLLRKCISRASTLQSTP